MYIKKSYKLIKEVIVNISKSIQAIMVLFVAFIFASCNDSSLSNINYHDQIVKAVNNKPTNITKNGQPKWKKQLNKMLTIGNKKLQNTPLQMVGYKLTGKVSSSKDKQSIIKEMLSDNQYLPKYPNDSLSYYTQQNLNSFSLIKIHRIRAYKTSQKAEKYNLKSLRSYLDTTLKKGQKLVRIQWKYKENPITTTAIVDDKKGLLYDNIITNTLIVETSHSTNDEVVKKIEEQFKEINRTKI